MNNASTHNAWLEEETARRYKIFTEQTTMYQELSQELIRLAQIEPGMRVLDLGCGTGVTTGVLLQTLGDRGQVYALDHSAAMLAVAKEQLAPEQVTFLQGDAAATADLLAAEPAMERIVCNSLFWQLRHKVEVLAALRQVLTPGGLLVFNAPEPYFIFRDIPRSPKVSTLFKQLAAERYGVGPQDLRTMPLFLANCGFDTVTMQPFERTRSALESYLFFQLPVATAWMEPPLDFATRLALLEEAQSVAEPDKAVRQRWMMIVARLAG